MLCYKLVANYLNKRISAKQLRISFGDVRMPWRYCTTCKTTPSALNAEIFEKPTKQIAEMLKPFRVYSSRDFIVALGEAIDTGNDVLAEKLEEEFNLKNSLSPKDYEIIAEKVRLNLGLEPNRLLPPREIVGPAHVRLRRSLLIDVMSGGFYPKCGVLTEAAAEALAASSLTGIKIYPAIMSEASVEKVYTFTVVGSGGIPKIKSCTGNLELRRCDECGEWWIWGTEGTVHYEVDVQQWDGSDFFRILGRGVTYISKKARCWFMESGLRLNLDLIPLWEIPFSANLPIQKINYEIIPPYPISGFRKASTDEERI